MKAHPKHILGFKKLLLRNPDKISCFGSIKEK